MQAGETPPKSLKDRVNFLFDNIRDPKRPRTDPSDPHEFREYTNTAVAAFIAEKTGKSCTRSHLSRVRNGDAGMSADKMGALAAFFSVDVAVLVNSDYATTADVFAQIKIAADLQQGNMRIEALREVADYIAEEDLGSVHDLLTEIRARRGTLSVPGNEPSGSNPQFQAPDQGK